MTTPTAAALRAAEQIVMDHSADTSDTCAMSAELLAETIDRETGLPELVAAMREIHQWSHMMDDGDFDFGLPMAMQERIDAALNHVDPQSQGERP